jgi:hypothetical protein
MVKDMEDLLTSPGLVPLFLGGKFNLDTANDPSSHKKCYAAGEYNQRLPKADQEGVVVRHNQLPVPELVHEISCLDDKRCSADRVQVCLVDIDDGLAYRALRNASGELDISGRKR